MSVSLSPTPSLVEERNEKKRRLLSWIITQARATRSSPPTGAKAVSPLQPALPFIQGPKQIPTSEGNDQNMNQLYATQVYAAQPVPTIPRTLNMQIIPGQTYSGSSKSTLYNAYPGPTPYTYRPRQPIPPISTDTYLNPEAVPVPYPSPATAGAPAEEAIAETTEIAAAGDVAPEASAMPQAAGTSQPRMVSAITQMPQEIVPPLASAQAPAAVPAAAREPIPVTAPGVPATVSYSSTGGVHSNVNASVSANAANTAGVQAATANPQPMTIANVIPGTTSSPQAPAPQPEPISSQPFVSRDYAHPASPLREQLAVKSDVSHLLKGDIPAVASRSPGPVSRSRPMHREDIDPSTSRSRASRGVSRSPASQYTSAMPPDYVPMSQALASRSRHAPRHPRAITPPIDHPRAIHASTTSPPAVAYREAPRESYSTSPRHSDGHRHRHGHSHSRHTQHYGDHEHGYGHSSHHRSSSQPAHHDNHHHRHHHHHHHHRRDPQHSSSSRPTYARQRSYSLDAGDPRLRGYNGSATYPQMMPQPQPHLVVYPSYTRSHHAPVAPTATGGIGTAGTTAGSAGQYRIPVQPPTSAHHQPVGRPVADGRAGYSVVPRAGQNLHVLQKPSRSMPGGSGGVAHGTNATDSRGRQGNPGFWSSLFGRKGRSSSAAPVQGNNYPQQNAMYGYPSSQPVQYYQGHHRPRHPRRRSSQY